MLCAQVTGYKCFSAKSKEKVSSSEVIEAILNIAGGCYCEPVVCEQALNTFISIIADNRKQTTKPTLIFDHMHFL